jgi:hypothetical protein
MDPETKRFPYSIMYRAERLAIEYTGDVCVGIAVNVAACDIRIARG